MGGEERPVRNQADAQMRAVRAFALAKGGRERASAQDRRDTRARQESLGVFEETTRATGAGAEREPRGMGQRVAFQRRRGPIYLPPTGATIQAPRNPFATKWDKRHHDTDAFFSPSTKFPHSCLCEGGLGGWIGN